MNSKQTQQARLRDPLDALMDTLEPHEQARVRALDDAARFSWPLFWKLSIGMLVAYNVIVWALDWMAS
jgi:hypothetical protein